MIPTARVMTYTHTIALVWLVYCGATSAEHHAPKYAVVFYATAAFEGAAAARESRRADRDRAEAVVAEAAARAQALADEDAVQVALAAACCENWWTGVGTKHDPTCPNQRRRRAA